MSNTIPGGFTPFTAEISTSAQESFNKAFQGFVGARYSAVAVSTQIVAGTNYKFFCNTQSVTENPIPGIAIVSIYVSLEGEVHITHIQTI